MKISKHKMLSFSVIKEIFENSNSLVVTSLSKVGENELNSQFTVIFILPLLRNAQITEK